MENKLKQRYEQMKPFLNERQRRLYAASEALAYGYGGIAFVEREIGVSHKVIQQGIRELEHPEVLEPGRIRKPGGGRKRTVDSDPTLLRDLQKMIPSVIRDGSEAPLHWTSKSTHRLAEALRVAGHSISTKTVMRLLHEHGYNIQLNKGTVSRNIQHDQDAQFEHINSLALTFHSEEEPVVYIQTNKNLLADGMNRGEENGSGACSFTENTMRDNADPDTVTFAVERMGYWWDIVKRDLPKNATKALVVADIGKRGYCLASHWRAELQKFANKTGLLLTVCHFPPGISKWDMINQRQIFTTEVVHGRAFISHQVTLNLIAPTMVSAKPAVKDQIDMGHRTGIEDDIFELLHMEVLRGHIVYDWNFSIAPEIIDTLSSARCRE